MTAKANIVYAVGRNDKGEFGVGNSHQLQELTALKWSNHINVTEIYNGYSFAIYRDDKDRFYAAGHNKYGSCLQGKSKGEEIEKLSVMNGLNQLKISKIFCNTIFYSFQAFIVTNDKNIYAFGRNDLSQLAIGSDANQYKVCRMQWEYGNIRQIQCAYRYSLILAENGSVYSTDYSLYGGNAQKAENKNGSKGWTHIKTLTNISRIAAGANHTLCCDVNGNVYSFGRNHYGQLGLNKNDNNKHSKPTQIAFFQQRHIIAVDVCCGNSHSLLVSQGGKVFAFGYNYYGQCGQGSAFTKNILATPTQIKSFANNNNNNIQTILCGEHHCAVITINQIIFMFGYNYFNQCVISSYNAKKDAPISINNFVQNKFKKQILSIHLGSANTKLILSNENGKISQMNKEEIAPKYNQDIIDELVNLGVGSKKECIAASVLVINPNDINEITDKVTQLQNKVMEEKSEMTEMSSFEHEISELVNIIKKHFNFMSKQEKTVNAMIAKSGEQNVQKLQNAKTKALETEKKLLRDIMSITSMNDFLTNIILIENLFNFQYNEQEQLKQKQARNKYAENISIYEKKTKPICNTLSFIDLIFQSYTDLTAFKEWLKILQTECGKENIEILTKPEAKQKNIERAFYKTFYVYAIEFGDKGFQRLTDILRCSLVFDSFDDLYQCFTIIEEITKANGGILRCKDRFNTNDIPFGYRDLLINIYCPQSQGTVVCEVQLHHQLFYQHKVVSHTMYKKARLFEDKNGNNLAYQYANKYIRNSVGDKQYEYGDEKENVSAPVQLLREWNLSQYEEVLIDGEGYDDPSYWKDISLEELKQIGFKTGHARKFADKSAKL